MIGFCVLGSAGDSQSAAAEHEFVAGIAAHAKGDEPGALEHLKGAAALDPGMTKAHFGIGSIAGTWYGVDGGDPLCEVAIDGYQKVVALEPSQEDAWKRLAYASYQMYRIDQAESQYRRALSLDAHDPEVLGGLATLDMQAAIRDMYTAQPSQNIAARRVWIDSPLCRQVRARNLARINEGIEFAVKAPEAKSKNVDLMAVLYALYATRAQIQCGDLKSFKDDMDASKRWNRLRMKTRQPPDQNIENMPPGPPPPPPARHWWNSRY